MQYTRTPMQQFKVSNFYHEPHERRKNEGYG
jgi:hypothetical protein